MSLASPEPRPPGLTLANLPAWAMLVLAVGSGVASGFTSNALTSRDVAELRARQDADDQWRAATEKRLAEGDRNAAVTNKGIEKDLQSLNLSVDALRRSLEVRGVSIVAPASLPMSPRQ